MTDARISPIRLMLVVLALALSSASHHAHGDFSQPGPFAAGRTNVTVTRPNATTFTARFYYPATAAGVDAPYDGAGAPYPAISFGHGFVTSVEQYQSTLEHLATWGYFVIATTTQGGLFPSHSALAADMSHCLTYLEQQNVNASSFLNGQVDVANMGMSGHSMGGGAAVLATVGDPRVKALATLAAANTNPSAINASASLAVPHRLISGSNDTITPPANHGVLMYNNTPGVRQLPMIEGGYHCGFIDGSMFGCDSGPMRNAVQRAITRRLLTEFFHLYLHDDQAAWRPVWGPEAFIDAQVSLQSDPRIAIAPKALTLEGAPGALIEATLTITNAGPTAASYELFTEDLAWPMTLKPAQTPSLAPGEWAEIAVQVIVPAKGPATDAAIISARSTLDGGTRAFIHAALTRITGCPADLAPAGGDGIVDVLDLLALLGAWGPCPGCAADLNNDDAVDVLDLLILLSAWGPCS